MRKKTEEKRQAILDAAKEVFQESSFDKASMSDIALRAEASKATLYSYFPSKDALFMEIIINAGRAHGDAGFDELIASEKPGEGLRRFGERYLAFVTTDEAVALARLAIAGGEHSVIGREFYARGPGAMLGQLTGYLAQAVAKGELRGEDPAWMAEHLKALYEAGLIERRLFGEPIDVEKDVLRRYVSRAVDIFLAYYAAPAAGG